jgi:hypothetical protein
MARRPVLSPALTEKLAAIGPRLGREPVDAELADVLDGLSALPAHVIVQASKEIQWAAELGWYQPIKVLKPGSVFELIKVKLGWSRPAELSKPRPAQELMKENAAYAWLFLFDANGYVREAALDAIDTPPVSPFFVAALAWRLNDWVPAVRRAAARCVMRVPQRVTTDVATEAAIYLLDRRLAWGRWRDEVSALDELFARSDVIAAVARHLQEPTGPLATRLRHALRYAGIDGHLLHLATAAKQPSVRSIAYQSLITGKAAWVTGFEQVWIDKVFNRRRRVPKFATREIRRPLPVADLIRQAASDKSAVVRKVAADGLIAMRSELENADKLIVLFASDPSPAVRSRADYLLRHPLARS